jgi:hypothetical protein
MNLILNFFNLLELLSSDHVLQFVIKLWCICKGGMRSYVDAAIFKDKNCFSAGMRVRYERGEIHAC